MRIATWNVNSLKQRLPRLLPWLDERRPDVVCLQETKLADEALAELLGDELADRGYEVAAHGEAAWNGVAILSRVGPGRRGARASPARPGSRTPRRARWPPPAAASACTRCTCRTGASRTPTTTSTSWPGWRRCATWSPPGPTAAVVCGDINIAPTDADVFDPDAYVGQTHVTPPEREALAELQALGLHDVVRDRWPDERVFSYWDYRAGMFHQDLGMRIDLILAGDPVAARVQAAWIDRQARKGKGPSDHAPVIVDLDEAPDGDIGPMVPPPSNPVTKRGAKKLPQA